MLVSERCVLNTGWVRYSLVRRSPAGSAWSASVAPVPETPKMPGSASMGLKALTSSKLSETVSWSTLYREMFADAAAETSSSARPGAVTERVSK